MTEFAIPAPAQPSLAIAGSDARFPVRRIFCVGRNYADHAREMGHDPDREPPFFFTKPGDAVIGDGAEIAYPPQTENLHHEAELVVAIGTGGRDIAAADALSHVWGYGAGNDLTRRDMQNKAKEMRRPWDMSKGFDRSAPCGALYAVAEHGHPPGTARITCTVDGAVTQESTLDQMIWPVADVIAYLSGLVELQPGDLIMTGTPAGVGPIAKGQACTVAIDGLGAVTTTLI
ncbi:fumarylacetoacetate hydrolase family protein [Acidimangrovimonas sediminis]|uniref:fumarylacetoacetate hydrolase family protein n=1 Tax=Acidimangrovimonas sediminis TaxID=2056283 RepID=UPI000C7FA309|nr:fumarylacetoacetate hydrolase family protein [Acidimangrovimonas sediminis]